MKGGREPVQARPDVTGSTWGVGVTSAFGYGFARVFFVWFWRFLRIAALLENSEKHS